MKDYRQMTVGEIVAENFDYADVFDRYGIDFCCNGGRSLDEACEAANADVDGVIAELEGQSPQESVFADFKNWPLDLLVDYIVKYHHRNIRTRGPEIENLLGKVCQTHGENHPKLFAVQDLFHNSLIELNNHFDKEEQVLFPYIYELYGAEIHHSTAAGFHCGAIQAPIAVMMAEHDIEGERYREIARLTNDYIPPADACNSYRVVLKQLKAFEAALHHHIHLESNIVFPWAERLEKELKKTIRMEILHNTDKHRVETRIEGLTACAEYTSGPQGLDILHVEVPKPLEGRGIASELVRFICDYARQQHLQVTATCPYAKVWLQRHPEYENALS